MISRLLFTLVVLLSTTYSYAQEYKSLLIGYNQSLPVLSEGLGYISANYDGEFLRIEGIVQNLEGTFDLTLNGSVDLYRGTQGTLGEKVSSMLPFIDDDGKGFELLEVANRFELTPDEVVALNNNELYINVSTDLHPEGEIKAQIVPQDADVYYCLLFGSQVTHPFATLGHGSVLITLLGDSVSISGSFRNLEGDFISSVGNANLKSAYIGSDGPTLANLMVEVDTISNAGIIRNGSNTYFLNEAELTNLSDGGIYVEIVSEAYNRAELRGQATPAVKQLYLANLRSFNTEPASNSKANGKILVQRNHGDSLYLSGAFQDLESPLAVEFAGGAIMYTGVQGQIGSVKELLVPSLSVGDRFGSFHSDDNFYEYLPSDLERLDNQEFFVTIHSEERFNGEVRGQIMPIGQNNFSVVMNNIQTIKSTDSEYKAYVDVVQLENNIIFSGSIIDSIPDINSSSLTLRSGLPGRSGGALMNLVLSQDDSGNYSVLDPNNNKFELSEEEKIYDFFDRINYLSLRDSDETTEIIRGQILPMLQSMYFAPLSDRQEVHHVNSEAKGMMILEQHADNEVVVVGSFDKLNSQLSNAISGSIFVNQGKFGEDGPSFRVLSPDMASDGLSGEIHAESNRFNIQNSIADSMQVSGLYINIQTEDEEEGELRGQVLELADGYYNTIMHATNVVNSSVANGSGQALLIRKGQRLLVNGSFSGLDGVVDFTNNGGIAVRNAQVDQNGDVKFLLFPDYAIDSLSGTFARQQNTLFLGVSDKEDLKNEDYYIELRKTSQEGPALRGQIQNYKNISPPKAELNAPTDRDTVTIDGLESDLLTFDFMDVGENKTVSLKISDRADFQPTLYARNFGIQNNIELNYKDIDSLLFNSSVSIGDTLRLFYQVVISDGADYNVGSIRSIYMVRGLVTGVPDIYRAQLTANHSVPPRQSTAFGNLTVELLDTTLRVRGQIDDMMGSVEGISIHIGMAGRIGPSVLDLNFEDLGGGSYELKTFDNTFELPEFLMDTLNDRSLYINVRTSVFPDGEVRGQILPQAEAYYYANLMGSDVLEPYVTEANGAISIEVNDGKMTITGSYSNLDSPYNFDIQGGSHLKLGLPGESGPTLFSLVPIELDSLNGVYQAQSNTIDITTTDIDIIENRKLYLEIYSDEKTEGVLRGTVSPILKGSFRSNLGSIHHKDIMNDQARGVLQIDLDLDNNIGVYGTFLNLPNRTDDFAGLIQYGYGFDHQHNDILNLNANFDNQDSISGNLLIDNNTIAASNTTINQLLHRAHYINFDVIEGYGGMRGQVLGLAQDYYFAKLNGYQMMPAQGGGIIKSVFAEKVGDEVYLSGALENENSIFSVHEEVIGNVGEQFAEFNGVLVGADYMLDPLSSVLAGSQELYNLLQTKSIYIQHNDTSANKQLRGQIATDARYIHLGLLSGVGQTNSINTQAKGRSLLVSNWDGSYSLTGSIKNLTGGLDNTTSEGMHLHFGLPGQSNDVEIEVLSSANNFDYTIEENLLDASEEFEMFLRENKIYFDVNSIGYPYGEIRSHLRPLSNYYYSATLNGQHVIANSDSPASGKLNVDVTNGRAVYYGSYHNLSFPLGDENEASQLGYNFVFESMSNVRPLLLSKTDVSAGTWNATDNTFVLEQADRDALENKFVHIAATDIFDNIIFRGRVLADINRFANTSNSTPSITGDTLRIEGDLSVVYDCNWAIATDDEDLMYKYQLSMDSLFENLIYEQNSLNQNEVTISFVQLQNSLDNAGVAAGDTVELFQRIYITDGSEDIYSPSSNFVAIRGIVEEPKEFFRAYLSGYQERSPVVSRGQGNINLVLQGNLLTISGTYDNLEGALAEQLNGGAHVQIGLAGEDGPIMFALNVSSSADATSGVINEFENIYQLSEEQIEIVRNREAYINIYSERFLTGELRGQILPQADNYYNASITASQFRDPSYSLDVGHLVLEVYADSIWVSGAIDHSEGNEYAIYLGLAGDEGQKIMDLDPIIDMDNEIALFIPGENKIANTSGMQVLMQNREIYVANNENTNGVKLRGQILPEIRAAFYSNLSGLKTVNISNSLAQGRIMVELGKENKVSFSGVASNFQGLVSDMFLSLGLPGIEGSMVTTLTPILSMDETTISLTTANNTISISDDLIGNLMDRELYIQTNSDNELAGEIRGQILALSPMYAESIITGSQVSADNSSQAHGLIEMEIHPQEINLLGSVSALPMEVDDVEYISASAALDGSILRSLNWEKNTDGDVTMGINENRQLYNETFVSEVESNRISIRVHSPQSPMGAARGILMPPAQALFIAPLSAAALTERTINSGHGVAMLVLRNDTQVKFLAGVDVIPTNSLRFRFAKGLPGVFDDNPFTYLGFLPNDFGGLSFNNNNINNFTEQIINDIRQGLHHVKISSSSNNDFEDYLRGQLLPIGYQSYQGTFTNYHPQGSTFSNEFGKVKAILNGTILSVEGHISIEESEVINVWIGQGGVNENSNLIYPIEISGEDILLQEIEAFGGDDLVNLANKQLNIVIATDEFPNGEIRAQLIPDINYYPSEVTIEVPIDNTNIVLQGDSSQLLTIEWVELESQDDLKYIWELSTDYNFEDIVMRVDRNANDFISFTYDELDSLFRTDFDLELGETVNLIHRVVVTDGSEDVYGDPYDISFTLDEFVDVDEFDIDGLENATLLPNFTYDGQTTLVLDLSKNKKLNIDIVNINRALLYSQEIEGNIGRQIIELGPLNLSSGKYQVIISNNIGSIKVLDWIIMK